MIGGAVVLGSACRCMAPLPNSHRGRCRDCRAASCRSRQRAAHPLAAASTCCATAPMHCSGAQAVQCAGTSGCMHCTVSHHVGDGVVREGEPRRAGAVAPNGHVGRHVIEARAGDGGVRCQGGARQEQGGGQKACGRAGERCVSKSRAGDGGVDCKGGCPPGAGRQQGGLQEGEAGGEVVSGGGGHSGDRAARQGEQ